MSSKIKKKLIYNIYYNILYIIKRVEFFLEELVTELV